jgi:acyl carrier protein
VTPDRDELLTAFEAFFRRRTGTNRGVRLDDRLREDLAIDSLLAVELLALMEELCDVELIDDPRAFEVRTVRDLVELAASCGVGPAADAS